MAGGTAAGVTEIAAARDCELTLEGEAVETATGTIGRGLLRGHYGWSLTIDGLYALGAHSGLVAAIESGELLYVSFCIGDDELTGRALIESVSLEGNVKGKVTYNVTLRGSGELEADGED